MDARVGDVAETKTFDVTDTYIQNCLILTCPITWAAICPGVLGKKMLILEEEEAILKQDCCLYNSVAHRPYGELGSVERTNVCCFVGFTSNLALSSMATEGGRNPTIVPGNCCEATLVDEIVRELKARMKTRGDTGQIQRAEENLREVRHLHAKMDAVMQHLQIPPVMAPEPMKR